MPRPVDRELQRRRRSQIIDAALTRFAADGFDRATTAAICRTAGIGSGTFFHYFPSKLDVLVAILELGTRETTEFFESRAGRTDAIGVLLDYVDHEAANLRDPRAAGFVRAVGAAAAHERIATALAVHQRVTRQALTSWVQVARSQGAVRDDLSDARIVRWLMVLVDGFASQVADGADFDAAVESDVLRDAVLRLLR